MTEPAPGLSDEDRVDRGLDALADMVDDLRHSDRLWSEMSDTESEAWSQNWLQLMTGEVRFLEKQLRAGKMTPTQRRHYQRLRHTLQRLWTTIDRLELRRPPIPRE